MKLKTVIKIHTPCYLLFCIFLTLKLCGVLHLSWWWITAPLWLVPALAFLLALLLRIIVAGLKEMIEIIEK